MTKLTKRILMIGASTFVVGGIIALTAFFNGGNPMNSALYVGDGGITALDLTRTENKTGESGIASFQNIEVNATRTDVTYREGDDFAIEIATYPNDVNTYESSYEVRDETLYVDIIGHNSYSGSGGFFMNFNDSSNNKNNTVTITVPRNTKLDRVSMDGLRRIKIDDMEADAIYLGNAFGDIQLNNCNAREIEFDCSSSDIKLTELYVDTIKCSNTFGNVILNNQTRHSFKTIDINASSTDIELSNSDAQKLSIDNTFGNIALTGMKIGDFTGNMSSTDLKLHQIVADMVDISNTFGEFKATQWQSSRLYYDGSSSAVDITGLLQGETRIDTSFGDVSINTSLGRDDYSLDIDGSFGDLTLEGRRLEGTTYRENNSSAGNTLYIRASSGDIKLAFSN